MRKNSKNRFADEATATCPSVMQTDDIESFVSGSGTGAPG